MATTTRETVIYVAADGNDAWNGTACASAGRGKNGPVATPEHASNLLREARRQGRLHGPAVIEFAGQFPMGIPVG